MIKNEKDQKIQKNDKIDKIEMNEKRDIVKEAIIIGNQESGSRVVGTDNPEVKSDEINRAYAALDKMYELLECGESRIELSSAKEILNLLGVPEGISGDCADAKLEVEIKVV